MDTVSIRQAKKDDYPALADLIAQLNQNPATQCIHSGEGAEAIHKQILAYEADDEIQLVLAEDGGQFIASIGCEYDQSLGRGWLWGPFNHQGQGPTVLDILLTKLEQILPPSITRLDAFLNQTNQKGQDFYLSQGFRQSDIVHVYEALPPQTALSIDAYPTFKQAQGDTASLTDSLTTLHNDCFPQTYESIESMVAKCDASHQLFICPKQDVTAGYIYADVDSTANEGYIHYVGVHPDWRRQGLGRGLLLTALKWLFEEKNVPSVALTVQDKLGNAQYLYQSAGFSLKYTGVALRRG